MEMVGKGEKRKGAVWVAVKRPRRRRSPATRTSPASAQFPLQRPEDVPLREGRRSPSPARRGGSRGKDEEFSFADAYAPLRARRLRTCDARVWSVFRRAAPSLNLSADWILAVPGAEPMPFCGQARPEADDEGRHGADARPLRGDRARHDEGRRRRAVRLPVPLAADDVQGRRRRRTCTSGRSRRSRPASRSSPRSRSWLPDPVGGVLWFGVDDTYSTVYYPMYCGDPRGAEELRRRGPPTSRGSRGTRPSGSSTSCRTAPTPATAT